MQPIAQTRQFDHEHQIHFGEWELLTDEIVLEIFKHLNALERASILRTCKQFHRLGTDYSLLNEEKEACQDIVRAFTSKNKTSSLFKPLNEMSLDWNNPWIALKAFGSIYQFGKLSLDDLAGIDISYSGTNYPSLTDRLQKRYEKEVRKKIAGKEGVFRFEGGCKFSSDTFKTFLEEINKNQKINKLVILCDLTTDQIALLAEAIKSDNFRVPEVLIKSDRKYLVGELHTLFGALRENKTITSFHFYNTVANDEVPVVIQALENNHTLERIALNGQEFGLGGFQALMNCFIQKRHIKSLTLAPLVYDEMIQHLFNELHRTALQELYVQFPGINDATGDVIAKAIRRCWRLKVLDFPNNTMSGQAARQIKTAMEENRRLESTWSYKPSA